MIASAISTSSSFFTSFRNKTASVSVFSQRNPARFVASVMPSPYSESSLSGVPPRTSKKSLHDTNQSYGTIDANMNPPIMPLVMAPGRTLDLSSVLFMNRIIFIGKPVTAGVAQRVISQLTTLASADEEADILIYLNCPGGSIYSVLAVYDCMSWVKPKVGTVCFGVAASLGSILLAGGEKGMRYAMPNARIMIHQPYGSFEGELKNMRVQMNEASHSRNKIDQMYAAFTGQPLELVQKFTDRDRYFSPAEAMDFGIIDGILETRL